MARVAAGDTVFTPGLAGLVLGEYRRLSETPASAVSRPDAPRLTERETEVLRLVAKGLSYKQIAARLFLSHRTVQNHVQNTLRKLQLHNRVAAGALRDRAGPRRRSLRDRGRGPGRSEVRSGRPAYPRRVATDPLLSIAEELYALPAGRVHRHPQPVGQADQGRR